MHFGGAMFFTDYSMSAMELARALEERGFESDWAPEHSHIPLSRKTPFPGGGDLPKQYYDAMDPFVVLAAASQVGVGEPRRSSMEFAPENQVCTGLPAGAKRITTGPPLKSEVFRDHADSLRPLLLPENHR